MCLLWEPSLLLGRSVKRPWLRSCDDALYWPVQVESTPGLRQGCDSTLLPNGMILVTNGAVVSDTCLRTEPSRARAFTMAQKHKQTSAHWSK
jgi:hypothetical protein